MIKTKNKIIKNRGVSLFISVVLMSILLFVSFAVVNITIKGSLFATSGRDSQFAFYAAEAENYSDSEIFGKRKILLNYHVSNQPCAMVKWTSQTQLFKYIQRKDKENYGK
jgi:hypothetical protein